MQVTAKYVNPPKEGKKFGNIKLPDDSVLWFPRGMESSFAQGKTYDIAVKDADWGGKKVQVITGVNTSALPGLATRQSEATANGGSDKWWMPFVSNTVAHAIAAGKIETPKDIRNWAAEAKFVAVAIAEMHKTGNHNQTVPQPMKDVAGGISGGHGYGHPQFADMEDDIPWKD